MPFIHRHRTLNTLLATTASIAWLAVTAPVHAQTPQAPTVAAGSIAITRQGATTVVNQTTDRGIIDWRSFSIGAGETVRFDQPGRSSVTLNRVTGSELSRIDGNLSANGQVWLANPNGVLIGNSGQVNVGGLLATTGRIDAAEFLKSGRAAIDQIGKESGIANFGTVNIAEGGYAALAAASIRNEGVVAARKGSVALGAGKVVTVDFTGDKLITFQVTKPLDQAVSGDSMISVGGKIAAEGGTVLMSARAAKGVMDNVVNLKGHVIANSVTVDGGTVTFGDGGVVQVSGKIDASNAGGKGGQVSILGAKVGLMDGASLDASGPLGGGTVLVGGDWQGKGPSHNATIAYVAPTASINVDATMAGDGGKAVVWADDTTRFDGKITARGGVLAGNGGQVETSGKRALNIGDAATVTTLARSSAGRAGAWLLDPNDITIGSSNVNITSGSPFEALGSGASTISTTNISGALTLGNVVIQTSAGTGGSGDITFSSGVITTGVAIPRTLTLKADRSIIIDGGKIELTGAAHNVILNSAAGATKQSDVNGNIVINGGTITTTGGLISIVAGASGTLAPQDSSVLFIGSYIYNNSVLNAGTGSISITGSTVSTKSGSDGVKIDTKSSILADGGVDITGLGANTAGSFINGIYIGESTIKTDSGALSITGDRRSGDGYNIHIDNKASISTKGGAINITGTATTGNSGSRQGVYIEPGANISTVDGLITIQGNGPASGLTDTDGVWIGGAVNATGTGAISITGVRGGGGSPNVNLASGSSVISATGDINLIGTATSGGAISANKASGVVVKGNVETADGTIRINGKGALLGGSNNDGVIPDGTIKATNAGSIEITGEASSGFGFAAEFAPAERVVTNTGDITIRANSIYWYGSSAPGTVKSTSGSVKVQPLTGASSIGVGGAVGGLNLSTDFLNTIDAKIEIGRSDLSAAITIADGYIAPKDFKFVSDSGAINFLGAVGSDAGQRSLTIENASGTTTFGGAVGGGGSPFSSLKVSGALQVNGPSVTTTGTQSYGGSVSIVNDTTLNFSNLRFNAGVSGSANLNIAAGSIELAGGSIDIGSGTLSFAGGAYLASDLTINAAATIFNADVLNLTVPPTYSLTIASGDLTLPTGTGAGKLTSLKVTSGATTLGGTVSTTGAQSYGGALTLSNDALLQSTGSGASLSFGGAINAAGKTLSLYAFGSAITLPALTVKELSVTTVGGAVLQAGGATATVTKNAFIDAGSGLIALSNAGNSIAELALTTTNAASVNVSGTMELSNSDVGSLSLTTTGSVTQSGPLKANFLSLSGAGGNYALTKNANEIHGLVATTGTVNIVNSGASDLQIVSTGVAVTSGLTLTQLGAAQSLKINGPVDLGSGAGSFTADGTIVGSGTISGSGATLTLSAGLPGSAVEKTGGVAVNVVSGTVSVNGTLTSPSPTPILLSPIPVAPTPPSSPPTIVATVSEQSVASVPSVTPTQFSQASQISQASTPSVASTVSATPSVGKSVEAETTPTLIGNEPVTEVVAKLIVSIDLTASVANKTLAVSTQEEDGRANVPAPSPSLTQSAGGATGISGSETQVAAVTAQRQLSLVNATAVGALIPPTPPMVPTTGAPLAAANTIKVDPADTGGANGQVIARGGADSAVGAGVSGAASRSGGSTTVVPGLLVQAPRGAPPRAEPPLADQPSTINEEVFLD